MTVPSSAIVLIYAAANDRKKLWYLPIAVVSTFLFALPSMLVSAVSLPVWAAYIMLIALTAGMTFAGVRVYRKMRGKLMKSEV